MKNLDSMEGEIKSFDHGSRMAEVAELPRYGLEHQVPSWFLPVCGEYYEM